MKQIALSFIVIGIFGIYAVLDRQQVKPQTPTNSTPQSTTKPRRIFDDEEDNLPPVIPPKIPATGTQLPKTSSKYRDGVYTGPVTDALYGNIQVKAIISGGRITDVLFLDFPHDKQTSREINGQAMPYLKSEAIAAQSAQVDIVSGATQTSRAFIESLQSALNGAI